MRKFTVKTKLTVSLSVILFVALLTASILNYQVSKKYVRNEIIHSGLPLTRDTIYSEIHGELMRPIFVASSMANDTFLRDWALNEQDDTDPIIKYLKEIRSKYSFFASFFISAKTGEYFFYNGYLKTVSRQDPHDIWYYDFLTTDKEYDLDVDTNQAERNVLTIFVNYKVFDYSGNLLGVTGVGLKMGNVSKLLMDAQERFGRRVFFVDGAGVIQAHADHSKIEANSIRRIPGIKAIATDILISTDEPRDFEYQSPDGEQVLLTARYIPEFDWFLIVEQDESEALSAARGNFIRTMFIGLLAALVIIAVSVVTVNHFQRRLEQMASTDELTGVANRREFERRFELARYTANREQLPFSLILLDVDDLKQVNDELGHLEGDRIIKHIAATTEHLVRPTDLVARWGGDEFIILAMCNGIGACDAAERIRTTIHEENMAPEDGKGAELIHVSVSCGVTEYREGDSLDSMVARADEALYQGKKQGRNRVEFCKYHG